MIPPPADEQERLRRGMEALARGELPPHVRDRLSTQWRRGTWSSNLSVPEFAAIRSVGFTPVGQVMGSAVYRIGWRGQPRCDRYTRGVATELTPFSDALQHVRGLALDRMVLEAAALDAHGIVGVKVAFRWFPEARSAVEYTAMGTAIQRKGAARLVQPFVSGAGGQDFAKLLRGGLVPCGLAMGIGTFHVHMGWMSRRWRYQTRYQTAEVPYLPDMAAKARARACEQLSEQVIRMRGDGAVGASTFLRTWTARCPAGSEEPDHILQFSVEGTAVARFDRGGLPPPTPVLHLQP